MILINVHELKKSFAHRPLFSGLSFGVESGDRIGLIGPNGAGKSTLLKILLNQMDSDGGTVSVRKGLKVGFLEQVPKFQEGATIQSTVMEGALDAHDWQDMARAEEIMSKLGLTNPERAISDLSGGWKKRAALARELMREPELLLLDEPTNHLDIESILWLESLLAKSSFATITVTHDRLFLQRVSNRILELDRRNPNGLLNIKGTYTDYLTAKEQLMAAQLTHEQKLKNTLRRETEWLRRGAQARQTKQQARIKKAEDLKDTVDEISRRNMNQKVDLELHGADKNPKKLLEVKSISKSYDGVQVVPPMSLLMTPKTRLGLLGSNGAGKSTLIRLLLGKEKPDTGSVFHSEHLKVAYFEQNRESLDPNLSLIRTLCPSGDFVEFGDTPVHVRSYLSRFLFHHEQVEMPVGRLSGGEQSRLLLAKLFLTKANMLVLDEPTNDLDTATLDVLEETLREFSGAVILVTHDRYFLDHVANTILAFSTLEDGNKTLTTFANLEQWESWVANQMHAPAPIAKEKSEALAAKPKKINQVKQDQTILKIEKAEARLSELTAESMLPAVVSDSKKLLDITKQMAELQSEIDALYNSLGT